MSIQVQPDGPPSPLTFLRAVPRLWGFVGHRCLCTQPASSVQGVLGLSFLFFNRSRWPSPPSSLGHDGHQAPRYRGPCFTHRETEAWRTEP